MSRNSSGVYTLPSAAFVAGTTIQSGAVNNNFSDIATALTQSLATTGVSSMTGPAKFADGAVGAPGIAFASDLTTGFWRNGAGQIGWAASGVQGALFNSDLSVVFAGKVTVGGYPVSTPVGMIVDFAGSTAPSLWLLCFGQAISRTNYSALFTAIGTTYGVGDGVTTFNMPDCRGRATAGKDNMGGVSAARLETIISGTVLGAAGGTDAVTLDVTQIPSHAHNITDPGHSHHILTTPFQNGSGAALNSVDPGAQGADTQTHTTGITINNTGGGLGHSNLQPTIVFNKIIYAGV